MLSRPANITMTIVTVGDLLFQPIEPNHIFNEKSKNFGIKAISL